MKNILHCPRCCNVYLNSNPVLSIFEMARLLAISCENPADITSFKKEICLNCLDND